MNKTLITLVLGAVMALAGSADAKKKDKDNPSNGGLPPGQAKKHRRGNEEPTTVYVQAPQREVVVVQQPQRQVVVVQPPPPRVVVTAPKPASVVITAPSLTVTH